MRAKRHNHRFASVALAIAGVVGIAVAASAAEKMKPAKKAPSDAQMIASAMKAGPASITRQAKIVAPDGAGGMRTLREGSNGYTCMPDSPDTPGPDPMCMDKNAMEWIDAYLAHKTPPGGKVGLMYMLQGGTDASNTDPYAEKPAPGRKWIKTPPHIMILGADASFYDAYPKDENPDTSRPYVMWAGTPYQHLMAPVR